MRSFATLNKFSLPVIAFSNCWLLFYQSEFSLVFLFLTQLEGKELKSLCLSFLLALLSKVVVRIKQVDNM